MRHLDVAIGILTRNGRVLVCQRKANDSFGGYWEFPGGKREGHETLEQCLHRELREELNVAVTIGDRLTPIRHAYPTTTLTLHPFLCADVVGEVQMLECQAARWIEPEALLTYQFPPANESLLREVIARLRPAPAALSPVGEPLAPDGWQVPK